MNRTANELQITSIDPVCGMTVEPSTAKLVSDHQGKPYLFCAEGCRKAFEEDPDKYVNRKPGKKNGCIGRWLDRMAKVNHETFGSAGPKCCG